MSLFLGQMTIMDVMMFLKSESVYQRADLIKVIRSGIQTKYIKSILDYTSLDDKELSNILPISHRQLTRYSDDHILNKEITSHIIQLLELFQKGYKVFGTDKFNLWIRTPNKVLSNNKPIDIMDTSIGIELIEEVLGRIAYGVYS